MTGWTNRAYTTTWVVVIVGLMGATAVESEYQDLSMCQNTCSSVPQDLWPYCCETHHTCCGQFADSCIHDCLPRVSTGDVSAVEERPGLCCALYNLCCFRETPRISSIRNDGVLQPQSFPITHRFSTLPGGPIKSRQSSVVVPRRTQPEAPAKTTFTKPQGNTDNKRPSSFSRPQPARNSPSSFRDTTRSNAQDDARTGISNKRDEDDKRPNHRFAVRNSAPVRPVSSENSKPQAKEEETEALTTPQINQRPSKLRKLSRPGNVARPLEARKIETPDVNEPTEERPNINTPKVLTRPISGKLVRPAPVIRPTNPRQLNKAEPEADKIEEEQRNSPSSFRDTTRSNAQDDARTGISNKRDEDDKRPNHRFAVRNSAPVRPVSSENSKPQAKEEETEALTTPQINQRPSKLRKLSRPGNVAQPLEARKIETPDVNEPTEERPNVDTPKVLTRPISGKLVRPAPVIRPTNPRQLNKAESEADKINEQNAEEEQRNPNRPAFLRRPLQARPLTQPKPTDQSTAQQEIIQTKSVQDDRLSKIPRLGSLLRLEDRLKNITPSLEVAEEPEQTASTTETEILPQRPKLLRPNIKPLRIGKSDSDVQSGKDSDQVRTSLTPAKQILQEDTADTPLDTKNAPREAPKRPNAFLEERAQKLAFVKEEKSTSRQTLPVEEEEEKRNSSPIRKVKRIRTSGPNKTPLSQNTRKPSTDSETSDFQNLEVETTTVTPTTRAQAQASRGISRSSSSVTTSRPQVTQTRSRGRTQATQETSRSDSQVTQERSRSDSQATQERSRSNSQVTQERSRSDSRVTEERSRNSQVTQERPISDSRVTQERSRTRTQVTQERAENNGQERTSQLTTQEGSRGNSQSTRGRSRSQSQARTVTTTEHAQPRNAKENYLPIQESTRNPLPVAKVEEMLKETVETSTDAPVAKDDKLMMDKTAPVGTQASPDDSDDGKSVVTTQGPPEPRELLVNQPQIKKIIPFKPQAVSETSPPQHPGEPEQKTYLPEDTRQTEELSTVKQVADILSELRQSTKPQQASKQSPEQESPRQGSQPQASRGSSKPQISRESSEPQQVTRQHSEPSQATRQHSEPQRGTSQRSSAQPTVTQSSGSAPRKSSRGRLTARQRLALANAGDQ